MNTCPFCSTPESSWVARGKFCVAFRDGFPVSPGHTLIIPRRHVAMLADLSPEEYTELFSMIEPVQQSILTEYEPAGFNIGINDGVAAGQTVMHLHLHVIPRYENDVEDPRGGVRWVLAEKAVYWQDGDK